MILQNKDNFLLLFPSMYQININYGLYCVIMFGCLTCYLILLTWVSLFLKKKKSQLMDFGLGSAQNFQQFLRCPEPHTPAISYHTFLWSSIIALAITKSKYWSILNNIEDVLCPSESIFSQDLVTYVKVNKGACLVSKLTVSKLGFTSNPW